MRTDDFVVTGWRGGTYGLRVLSAGYSIFLQHQGRLEQEVLFVELPGTSAPLRIKRNLSRSFWRSCPEVRAAKIGQWMRSRGDAPWPSGKPPRYRAYLYVGEEITLRLN